MAEDQPARSGDSLIAERTMLLTEEFGTAAIMFAFSAIHMAFFAAFVAIIIADSSSAIRGSALIPFNLLDFGVGLTLIWFARPLFATLERYRNANAKRRHFDESHLDLLL